MIPVEYDHAFGLRVAVTPSGHEEGELLPRAFEAAGKGGL